MGCVCATLGGLVIIRAKPGALTVLDWQPAKLRRGKETLEGDLTEASLLLRGHETNPTINYVP